MNLSDLKPLARLFALALVLVCAAPAAEAGGRNPGSLIVFPEFDSTPGHDTLITITNRRVSSNQGAVRLAFKYVSGVAATRCEIADRFEDLTPGDSISVLASTHNPGVFHQGFLYVYAVKLVGGENVPIAFDYLAADVVQLDGTLALLYSINPVMFEAKTAFGQPTDLDADGLRDLNGSEYEAAPDRILVPRFLGQASYAQSELVLVGLTGGKQFTTLLDFLIFNDNEEIFSAQYAFHCWARVPLLSINGVFGNTFLHAYTDDSANEIIGFAAQEAGWIQINGNTAWSTLQSFHDPAFLAVLSERGGSTGQPSAEPPFYDGVQTNGDLLPSGVLGDSN